MNCVGDEGEGAAPSLSDSIIQGLEDTGLVLLRLPADDSDDAALENAHIAIGQGVGQLMHQNRAGDYVIGVRDVAPADAESTRGFLSSSSMKLHTDGWDAAALMCLQPAHSGGESLFALSQSVCERIDELRPDLAPILFEQWDCDVRVLCDDPSRAPLSSPIFARQGDRLFCRYGSYILRNGAQAGGNELSGQRRELLDLFDAVTAEADLQRCVSLARGDAIWMNNRTVLHGRQAFNDNGPTRRSLSRLWVRVPGLAQPDESFLHFDIACFGTD